VISHIYKTIDGGESWLDQPLTNGTGNSLGCFLCGQGYYDNTIVVSPTDPNTVVAGGIGYLRSQDGGASWAYRPTGATIHPDAHDLQFPGKTLYIANDGGLFSTDDGDTVSDLGYGQVTHQYYSIETDPNDHHRILAGSQDNGLSVMADDEAQTLYLAVLAMSLTVA